MSEHTEIRPAFTPEEWNHFMQLIAIEDCRLMWVSREGRELTLQADDTFYTAVATPDEAFKIASLANAALPDGDPRKITREKVEAIQNLIDDYVPSVSTNSQLADGLLDVLRALLPPE